MVVAGLMAVVVTSVVGAVVVVVVPGVVVMVAFAAVASSPGIIPCLQIVRFLCFMKRLNGPAYGQTDLQTYGQMDRPSY